MDRSSKGFLWGATVAAHAVEGENYLSDWWRWEQRPGRVSGSATSQTASGHWTRYNEDFGLAAKLGLNALLVSVEWARIEPAPDTFDQAALDHYTSVFRAAVRNGLEPICVLQWAAIPAWFADGGGWTRPDSATRFSAYTACVVEALTPHCRYWLPTYDPARAILMGYLLGAWPPGRSNSVAALRAYRNLLISASKSAQAIHALDSKAQIGLYISAPDLMPFDEESPWDYRVAKRFNNLGAVNVLDAALREQSAPFLGVSLPQAEYAFLMMPMPGRRWVRFAPLGVRRGWFQFVDENGHDMNSPDSAPDTETLLTVLDEVSRFQKPLFLIGDQCAAVHEPENRSNHSTGDEQRAAYLVQHIAELLQCRNDGYKISGYFHRSLLDGFEWELGYSQRFGLLHVDRETMSRTPNPSAYLFGDIARHDTIRDGAVRKYCPSLAPMQRAVTH